MPALLQQMRLTANALLPDVAVPRRFAVVRQLDVMDCGAACLATLCRHHGRPVALARVRDLCGKGKRGVTLLGISKAAEALGFTTLPVRLDVATFLAEADLPCILHWRGDHFVVAYRITRRHVHIADPRHGNVRVPIAEFTESWAKSGTGVGLFLRPTEAFRTSDEAPVSAAASGLQRLLGYLLRFRHLLGQLGIGALLGSALTLVAPFLTQALIDHGVGNRDIDFVYAILIAQVVLFFSRTANDFLRGWILVHVGARVNVAVISEFLAKLMRLPLSYFSRRNLGDVLQRINDHHKIEEFLTSHSIGIVFSLLNLAAFGLIMAMYSGTIVAVFLLGTALSFGWVALFLARRRALDYRQFQEMSANQNCIVQLVHGMPEIKLNRCEASRRWEWEGIQARLFRVRLRALAVEQYQKAGTLFINEGKNIAVTFIAAQQVVSGHISLGMMVAITYILGQMNAPVEQLLNFVRQAQDAKIGMERLGEVQDMADERDPTRSYASQPPCGDISLRAVGFRYNPHDTRAVLDGVDLVIPHRQTTAIVGASGSGKTTLLKLLLKFSQPSSGRICIGDQDLESLCPDMWRSRCGVVMQGGFLFSASIARNIAMDDGPVDHERLIAAARIAHIHDEICAMPQGYETHIGAEGMDLSGGQSQRLLIARAVYKNPEYLFFDEATSSLDASNERAIQEQLQDFFAGRTVLVIAHRLSTVRRADRILVLEHGRIVEQGNHDTLVAARGRYYTLVKDQLELGS